MYTMQYLDKTVKGVKYRRVPGSKLTPPFQVFSGASKERLLSEVILQHFYRWQREKWREGQRIENRTYIGESSREKS